MGQDDIPGLYHCRWRQAQSLDKDTPEPRAVEPASSEPVGAVAEVGGLHHRYSGAPHRIGFWPATPVRGTLSPAVFPAKSLSSTRIDFWQGTAHKNGQFP